MGASISLPDDEAQHLKQLTKFKKDEIQRSYKNFMHNNPDGYLTPLKFRAVYGQVFQDTPHLSDHIFKKLDINQDGQVSFKELMLNFSIIMKGTNIEKLHWAFDVYDLDANGEITLSELKHALTFLRENPPATHINEETFHKEIESIFRVVDTDSDGVLSKEEFVDGMKR